ncbi:fasciclin-like arabinogalactan protein 19 [Lactuca sativa]|uniref:fasciclin-like arabinogalactan protein 19 n=1 Tax=Lactuca sativa TaxID=4236 RepID=UPI000CA73A6C|nr:fasciclin-like arabinogalactan protein 19 [Lactuca sativa]
MASSTSGISTFVIIPLLIIPIAIINIAIVSAVREGELNVVFGVLRGRGYHLFANAIATSDIHYDIKSNGNFTLFAPINSALFAIDMTMAASNYVEALRYHVVPRRMSISDLLSLPPGENYIPTLMPGQNILVEQRRDPRSLITVGGVDIVVPGMFYGRDIAVHGLDGILEFRPHTRSSLPNVTAASLSDLSGNMSLQSPDADLPPPSSSTQDLPPPLDYNPIGNLTFQFPEDVQSPPSDSSSDLSPTTDGIASPNQSPSDSTYLEEHVSRAKLLELTSAVADDDLSSATEQTSNRLQKFTPADDETVDCWLADNGVDPKNAAIHARKLYIASDMICAQK